MNEKVKKYLEEEKAVSDTAKDKKLIELGLYEKVYYEGDSENPTNEGYPFYDNEQKEFYKKVPCEVSEEEYQEILRRTPKKVSYCYFVFVILAALMFAVATGYLIFCIYHRIILWFFIYGPIVIGIGAILLASAFIIKLLTEDRK